jgi:hypothetical protein
MLISLINLMDKNELVAIVSILVSGAVVIYVLHRFFDYYSQQQPISAKQAVMNDAPQLQIQQTYDDVPIGLSDDRSIYVTDAIQDVYDVEYNGLNWFSCDIYNNGPDPVYYALNQWMEPEAPLLPNESISINLQHRRAIKKIFFKCASGGTATVSLHGLK